MSNFETLDPEKAREIEAQAVKFYTKGPDAVVEKIDGNGHKTYEHTRLLAHFKSVFPLELFPDELIISERRIIWIHKYGPWMSRALTILPQDIADIEASHGPLFGHLHVRNFTGNEEIIMEHMWNKDLSRARDLVEALMSTKRGGLHVGGTKKGERQKKLEELMHVDF